MKIYNLLVVFAFLALASCKDDPTPDGMPGPSNPSIIGTWTLTDLNSIDGTYSQTGGQLDVNGNFVMTGENLNAIVEIEEDNTYSSVGSIEVNTQIIIGMQMLDGPTTTTFLGNGTWSKSGNTLTLVRNGETTNCMVITLTETDFVMDYPFESVEDDGTFVTTLSGDLRYEFTR